MPLAKLLHHFITPYTNYRANHRLKFLPCYMECRHGLAMRILSVRLSVRPSARPSARPPVRPSVCLSNACIVTKMEERYVYIFIPYERPFI